MARKIEAHKGGRTERFEARMTPEAKAMLQELAQEHDASMADLLAGAVQALYDLPIVEAHAMIFGVRAWAFEGDEIESRTALQFGDGKIIRSAFSDPDTVYSGDFDPEDIKEFFMSIYFEHLLSNDELLGDKTLLEERA